MKVGDKLICIKELQSSPFCEGEYYTIFEIKKDFKLINFDIIFFEEYPDYMVGSMYIDEIFATEKRYRKLKLEKTNKIEL